MPMIKFKDKPKKERESDSQPISVDDDYQRQISFAVNDEILEEAEIGTEVVVTIRGVVTAARSNESSEYTDKSITVKASKIEVYEYGENEKEEEFSKGFNSMRGES